MGSRFNFCLIGCFISVVAAKYYGISSSEESPFNKALNYDYQIADVRFNWKGKEPQEDQSWSVLADLGQVSGIATSRDGKLFLFHRADNVWDERSFNEKNIYVGKADPIQNDTVVIVDSESGRVLESWGGNKFYMPHGISIDPQGNVWLTDVALHQVFRFKSDQFDKPDLVLGEKFVPGDDEKHFCKPTDVAIASSGIIYISDGYCNSRILVFAPDGSFISQIGFDEGMLIPHSLTLLENENLICAADRENRRILCFTAGLNADYPLGKLVFKIQHQQLGRVFAIDHIGDVLLALNGPDIQSKTQLRGISLDLATEQLINSWAPKSGSFQNPHDISVSADGSSFFVSDITVNSPKNVFKFNL